MLEGGRIGKFGPDHPHCSLRGRQDSRGLGRFRPRKHPEDAKCRERFIVRDHVSHFVFQLLPALLCRGSPGYVAGGV